VVETTCVEMLLGAPGVRHGVEVGVGVGVAVGVGLGVGDVQNVVFIPGPANAEFPHPLYERTL
jgi:hypothetical protein